MLGMYLLGISVALVMAWVFKNTLLKGEVPLLILELPPYKMPIPKQILRHMWDRAVMFLRQAGTVILGINILLWFLATYPKDHSLAQTHDAPIQALQHQLESASSADETAKLKGQIAVIEADRAGAELRHSFAGSLGRLIEPVIAPLGFDWKMGIGIVTSFAAREVFVSTMATVYSVEQTEDKESGRQSLAQTLQQQRHPDGSPVYTTLTGLTLMVFYVFALQCVSTMVIVRRETNSWKWPAIQWLYMGTLAWGMAFAVRHIGMWLG
jgi:ferrous iron transport protein B